MFQHADDAENLDLLDVNFVGKRVRLVGHPGILTTNEYESTRMNMKKASVFVNWSHPYIVFTVQRFVDLTWQSHSRESRASGNVWAG